jgi:hypothetical protein
MRRKKSQKTNYYPTRRKAYIYIPDISAILIRMQSDWLFGFYSGSFPYL